MKPYVFIDGEFYDKENAKISVWDHGFLYGDGVFEGIRAYNNRVFMLDEHLKRLYESAKTIRLKIPYSFEEFKKYVIETCAKNEIQNGYIRLVVSRGFGDLGIDIRKCPKATVVIIADTIKLYPQEMYEKGLKLIIASTRKNFPAAINPKIKSLNYLNNILAKIECIDHEVEEVVMINSSGFVTECSADNIFIVKDGKLITPSPSVGLLIGVTRNVVMKLALEHGYKVEEALLDTHDLFVADECFLTGTGAELIPVIEISGMVICDGMPGEITNKLIRTFKEYVSKEGTPIYKK